MTNKQSPNYISANLIVETNRGIAKMPVWCRASELVEKLAGFRKGMQDKIDSGDKAWEGYAILNASIEFASDEFPQLDRMVS